MPEFVELEITNMMGFSHLHFPLGSVTRIGGPNGAGKSCVLKTVKTAFSGGSNPDWLKAGEKQGFMKLQHRDGWKLEREVKIAKDRGGREKGFETKLIYRDPNGVVLPAPQTIVENMTEGIDPGDILAIDHGTVPGRE